jgi:hypothetical protein
MDAQEMLICFFVGASVERGSFERKAANRKRAREGEAAFLATTNVATKECMKTTPVG